MATSKPAVVAYEGVDGSSLEVLNAHFVGTWDIVGPTKKCGVCKGDLLDVCPACASKKEAHCDMVAGTCQHVCHQHCISAASSSGQPNCPVCNTSWVAQPKGATWKVVK